MRYLLLLPLAILLALSACKSDKDSMAEIVEEWQGREIVFPDVMTDFLTGDTFDLDKKCSDNHKDYCVLSYYMPPIIGEPKP